MPRSRSLYQAAASERLVKRSGPVAQRRAARHEQEAGHPEDKASSSSPRPPPAAGAAGPVIAGLFRPGVDGPAGDGYGLVQVPNCT
jgi:hypothetical protein